MHPLINVRYELFATATRLTNLANQAEDYDTRSQTSIAFEEVMDAIEILDEFIERNVPLITPVTV